jgi:hypothetical protein
MSLHPPSHRRQLVPLAWVRRKTTELKKQPTTKTVTIQESNPMKCMGERVAKYFGEKVYYGTVVGYDDDAMPVYWHVMYDDDDEEDMELDELIHASRFATIEEKLSIQEWAPKKCVGERVAKYFGKKIYYGTIAGYNNDETPIYWHVEYDDGDKEDMEFDELKRASNLAKIQEKLTKRNGGK